MGNIYPNKVISALFLIVFSLFSAKSIYAQCNQLNNDPPRNGIDSDCDGLDDLYLHLPPYIYMVEGKSFELYFRNIFLSNHTYTYNISVVTDLQGAKTNDKWSITPAAAAVGEHPFTIQVKDTDNKILASASSVVRVAAAQTPTSVGAKKIIVMGHSLIDQGIMPYYLRQMTDEAGNPTVTHHGTRISWSDNMTKHEGKGGASWKYFAYDADSPLTYGTANTIDFRKYFNEVICSNCNPDYFVIQLDVNDFCVTGLLNGTTQQEINDFIQNIYVADIKPVVDALRSTSPNTKIGICLTPPANDRPNVFLNHFGSTSILNSTLRWKKIVNTIYTKYSEYFGGKESENIYLLPIHLGVDNINHYDDVDPFHPFPLNAPLTGDNNGYRPIAKSVYAWVKNMMNTGVNGACNMSVSVKNIKASANATFSTPSDDTYNFALNVTGFNAGTSWKTTLNNQTITGNFGTNVNFGPLGTNAPQTFEVISQNNANCKTLVAVSAAPISNGTPQLIDLQLKITTDNPQPQLFTNFKVTYTITNNSSVAAQVVWAKIPKPAEIAFANNAPFTASQGTFDWFYSSLWDIGLIPANGSATLKVDYYLLKNTSFPIFGQVYSAVQDDIDSKPNNGNGTSATEDDEDVLYIGQVTPTCTNDATAPVISGCPNSQNLLTAGTSSTAQWVAPTTSDNCPGAVALTATHASGASFPIGTTTITYTAKDASNNISTCSFTVKVTQQVVTGLACEGNILKNPGFENGLNDWLGSGIEVGSEVATGTKSLKMCTSGTAARQMLPAVGGTTYQLTWRGKTLSNTQNFEVMIKFLSSSFQVLTNEIITYNSANVFGNGSLQKTAPTGTTWIEVSLIKPNSGCVFIDDLCLKTTNGGTTTTSTNAPVLIPCNVGSNYPWEDWISAVKIGNVQKSSSKSTYSYTTTNAFSLNKSSSNVLTLQGSYSYFTFDEYWRVWIDYNRDNVFQTSEMVHESVMAKPANGTPSKTVVSTFVVPTTATTGSTRMRVVMSRGSFGGPCGNIAFGEVEDYVVNIVQPLTAGNTRSQEEELVEIGDVEIFPNPASDKAVLHLKQIENGTKVNLLNQYGALVRQYQFDPNADNLFEIELSGILNGIYFVEIAMPGKRKSMKKLVVSKLD